MMSNYLFAMGRTSVIEVIQKYFSVESGNISDECTVNSQSEGVSYLIVEKQGANSEPNVHSVDNEMGVKENFFFKGWLVDHDKKSITLGANGFREYHVSHEGRSLTSTPLDAEGSFVLASWDKERLLIQNDQFCLFPVMFFTTPEIVVASDSLFVLSKIRKALGLPCELNQRVVYSRAWTHGLACAVMSNETIVKGIELISPGGYVTADIDSFNQRRPSILKTSAARSVHRDIKHLFASEGLAYDDALAKGVKQLCGMISSIMQLDEVRVKFGLSGGLDSRVLLALLLRNPAWMEKVDITTSTHPSRSGDFDVVSSLANQFDFDFNNTEQSFEIQRAAGAAPERVTNSFGLWVLSSMGLFDMMYLYRSYWSNPVVIEMGGHGAEIIKGTFTETKLTDILHIRPRHRFKAIRKEIGGALSDSGIDIDEGASFQWHHLCFKSAIQNGRFVDRTCLALRPFLNSSLYSLATSEHNPHLRQKEGEATLLHDILIMMNPELAAQPFENPKYNLTEEYIKEHLESLSQKSAIEEIEPYKVYGSVMGIINGPAETFMAMVSDYDFGDKDPKEATLELLEKQWSEIAGTNLEQIFQSAYDLAKTRLQDPDFYSPSAGTPAAKIISLALLD